MLSTESRRWTLMGSNAFDPIEGTETCPYRMDGPSTLHWSAGRQGRGSTFSPFLR